MQLEPTKENLNKLRQIDVMDLTDEEWLRYYKLAIENDFLYMFNGVTKFTGIVYGTPTKRLEQLETGEWGISQGMVVPICEVKPLMMNKERFAKAMLGLGASERDMQNFFDKEWTKEEVENF